MEYSLGCIEGIAPPSGVPRNQLPLCIFGRFQATGIAQGLGMALVVRLGTAERLPRLGPLGSPASTGRILGGKRSSSSHWSHCCTKHGWQKGEPEPEQPMNFLKIQLGWSFTLLKTWKESCICFFTTNQPPTTIYHTIIDIFAYCTSAPVPAASANLIPNTSHVKNGEPKNTRLLALKCFSCWVAPPINSDS